MRFLHLMHSNTVPTLGLMDVFCDGFNGTQTLRSANKQFMTRDIFGFMHMIAVVDFKVMADVKPLFLQVINLTIPMAQVQGGGGEGEFLMTGATFQ